MVKKLGAVLLSFVITALSCGPQAYEALAGQITSRSPAKIIRVSAPAPTGLHAGAAPAVPALPVNLQAPGVLAAPQAPLDIAPADVSKAGQKPSRPTRKGFERMVSDLGAPSLVGKVPFRAPAETSWKAGGDDFALRLGIKPSETDAAVEESASSSGGQSLPAPREHEPSAKLIPAVPAEAQARSALFPTALASFSAASLVAFKAAALAFPAAAAAAATLIFGAAALRDWAVWAAVMAAGRGVSEAQFRDFVTSRVMSGQLDAGIASRIALYPSDRRDPSLAAASGGKIYLRRGLIAWPAWFDRAVLHEFHHLNAHQTRGPPSRTLLGRLWEKFSGELGARHFERKGLAGLKALKIPVLDRVLRQTQNSLHLDQPFDMLVLNPASEELKDASIYKGLSDGKARVETVNTGKDQAFAAPQDYLAKRREAKRAYAEALKRLGFEPRGPEQNKELAQARQAAEAEKKKAPSLRAAVLGRPFEVLPQKADGVEAKKLALALKQLDELFLLATGRIRPGEGPFKGLENLAPAILEGMITQLWHQIAATKLKGMAATNLVEQLYDNLQNQGLVFLPFGSTDPGVVLWEKLLRYWEAEDGGRFTVARVDLENGGHVLVARKAEARVGLWLKPIKGAAIKDSIPIASASEESRRAAREALGAAGFAENLQRFDDLGVQVEKVFGADIARQEIYVTVPRRNVAAMHQFAARSSVLVEPSETHIVTHLTDSARIQNVLPVHSLGLLGLGGSVLDVDTGSDNTHEDFGGAQIERIDLLNLGPEDWIGHGTHTEAIEISRSGIFIGIASLARAIMVKVFGGSGAVDGNVMAGGAIGWQRGVDVIRLSLGSRGFSDSNLAQFFSQLTLQKTPQGDYCIIVASAGNSGPFDESGSAPGTGRRVIGVAAAAKSLDDGLPEVPFYSSTGPNRDRRVALPRITKFPKLAGIGGDVETNPGSPRAYEKGVVAAKSKDMPPRSDDTPDGKRTFMSGTSMAAPMVAMVAILVKLALRSVGAVQGFMQENLPLAVEAIMMRTASDMQVPVWFQGSGLVNAWEAVKLALSSRGPEASAWIARYKAVLDLEDQVYQVAQIAADEAQARFEDAVYEGAARPLDKGTPEDKANAEMVRKFNEEGRKALPALLEALKDPVWLVREQAALTLLNLGRVGQGRQDPAPDIVPALAQAALKDEDARVRQMAFLALAERPGHGADVLLQKSLADQRWDAATYAAYALARHGDRGGAARIVSELSNKDKKARFTSAWLLGQLKDKVSAVEAEALSAKVKDISERGNIRHVAAAALANIADAAPRAVSGKAIIDLLDCIGPQNLALTRTVSKIFPVALQSKEVQELLKTEPVKGAATDWVLKNKASVYDPGALGELVQFLARELDIPLDLPTPPVDPTGLGVYGVDPEMGPLDLIVDLPTMKSAQSARVSRYWDSRLGGDGTAALSDAGLEAAVLGRFEARLEAALPVSGSLWLKVPEHKLYALTLELKHRGYLVRLSRPQYSMASRAAAEVRKSGGGLTLDVSGNGALPVLPPEADLSLVKVTARGGASEARVIAELEYLHSRAADPLRAPVTIALSLAGPSSKKGESALGRVIDRLALNNVGVVLPAGNEGPAENSLLSPADAGLAVVVAAADITGPHRYSSRGSGVTWAEPVADDAGTAAAAERSAEKIAQLAGRMAEIMKARHGRLPDGYFFYLVNVIKQTLEAMPQNQPSAVGGGLFARPENAMELLETRLLDPEKAARDSKVLIKEARRRHVTREAAPESSLRENMLNAVSRTLRAWLTPNPDMAASASNFAKRFSPEPKPSSAERLAQWKSLRQILADGTVTPSGQRVNPFAFRTGPDQRVQARDAGLEGFLYRKLELERESGGRIARDKIEDYFNYIDALLSPIDWTSPIREGFSQIRDSRLESSEKNRRLNDTLIKTVKDLQEKLRSVDFGVYMILARADNQLRPGKNFFDSLDEARLRQIREKTHCDVIWLLDTFEIGEVNRWGTGGGSPYAIKGYRIKEELGGEEAFKRFVQRAHARGFLVGVDEIPNHKAIDSDRVNNYPESVFHIVPPQNLSDEEIVASTPRHIQKDDKGNDIAKDPAFRLVRTDRYPENGRRVSKKILVHHPVVDYGGDMYVDMAQTDLSQIIARSLEALETARLFKDWDIDMVRQDMANSVLSAKYFDHWMGVLRQERDHSSGWAREEMDRLIEGFQKRWEALGGAEYLEEVNDAIRAVKPEALILGEVYTHETEYGRTGATAAYNKNDHVAGLGQFGSYDAVVSRNGWRIREAEKNVAFRTWQRGGATLVSFGGTHDGGEGNPVDKFGKFYKAAMLTLLIRPLLVYMGFEQGVPQREKLIGDLSKSVDTQKDIPLDIPVKVNPDAVNPENAGYNSLVLSEKSKPLISVLDLKQGNERIQARTETRWDSSGNRRVLLKASNFADNRASAVFGLKNPLLAAFGAFEPRADRTYVLKDLANKGPDGQPAVYRRSGKDLLDKGLYIELESGGVHLFEVEEVNPNAPTTGPPGQAQVLIQPPQAKPDLRTRAVNWLKAPWSVWVERLVLSALVPFLLIQGPQIWKNSYFLTHDPGQVSILPWIGYSTGILANSNLWGYHIDGKRHAVAAVQAAGVLTSSIVLRQIFLAHAMPAAAAWVMTALIALSVAVNVSRWAGRLPEKTFGVDWWTAWNRFSTLAGFFALPLGFSVTFNLMKTHPAAVLAVSAASMAAAGLQMARDLRRLPRDEFEKRWGAVGAVIGTLIFVFLPISQLKNIFSDPGHINGLAVGTIEFSTWGNLLETTGAIWHRNKIWFIGAFWAVAVGGWGILLSLTVLHAVSAAFFSGYSAAVLAYLYWVLRQIKKNHPDSTYRDTLKFILQSDKKI